MQTAGNTILVTGGSSGIGRELARRFHDLGNVVIVAARDTEKLAETIGDRANMHAIAFDAGEAGGILGLAEEAVARFPELNVLVNNAGIMHIENLAMRRDIASSERIVAVNLLGPIRLIDALIDHLSQRPDAAIVNVTSGLAFVPRPSAATYSATKAAMHSYTVSLRGELAGRVEVIELPPPLVRTDLLPGQSENEAGVPLNDFIDEVMTLFQQRPTPSEILVQRVHRHRYAERDGNYEAILAIASKM